MMCEGKMFDRQEQDLNTIHEDCGGDQLGDEGNSTDINIGIDAINNTELALYSLVRGRRIHGRGLTNGWKSLKAPMMAPYCLGMISSCLVSKAS